MKVSARDVEKYAMKALEEDSKRHVVEGGLEIFTVGDLLGMTREESQDCADRLRESGWITPNYRLDPPTFTITSHGREEIAKLKLPRWRRWIDKHPTLFNGAIAALVSGTFLLLAKLLEWWLR